MLYYIIKLIKKMRGSAIVESNIHSTSTVESGSHIVASTIARHSFCGYDCSIINAEIGAFCSIANGVSIGGAHHPIEYVSTSPVFLSHKDSVKAKFANHDYLPLVPTIIGNDVWIGESSLVKAGVTIGHGAIVGMGAVVTKDIPPYAIFAGNPAKLIRMRFSENIINGLLAMKWWEMADHDLKRIGPLISNPLELLKTEGFQ